MHYSNSKYYSNSNCYALYSLPFYGAVPLNWMFLTLFTFELLPWTQWGEVLHLVCNRNQFLPLVEHIINLFVRLPVKLCSPVWGLRFIFVSPAQWWAHTLVDVQMFADWSVVIWDLLSSDQMTMLCLRILNNMQYWLKSQGTQTDIQNVSYKELQTMCLFSVDLLLTFLPITHVIHYNIALTDTNWSFQEVRLELGGKDFYCLSLISTASGKTSSLFSLSMWVLLKVNFLVK